ncbi:D-glycero-alpha-D-manno-heptose-1,7-bisphosphate 7-phosphatase [Macellibacteroides fermentans]|uniref:D-glycero-alpha-D-manno-heptose-1,7-bisphosphate 7-phosphatase n=1 Tax=Macellibacteroides fermentans TaxID=879969 RepID=UPI00406BEC9F
MGNKAIFLDRDGTININYGYVYKPEDFVFTYRAIEALKLLYDEGFSLFIITNQSGIARGYYSEKDLLFLNEWLLCILKNNGIEISSIYYCPHHPKGVIKKYSYECDCRKPKTLLFEKAIEEFNISTKGSFAVGDNLSDLEITKSTNVKGILLNDDTFDEKERHIITFNNLYQAAKFIVSQ